MREYLAKGCAAQRHVPCSVAVIVIASISAAATTINNTALPM
jgi:hypothetical protein